MMVIVHNLPLEKYVPISIDGEYVFRKYDRIQSFLTKYVGGDICKVLLIARQDGNVINFFHGENEKLKPMEEFSEEEARQILTTYNALLYSLEHKLQELLQIGTIEGDSWTKLLKAVFDREHNLIYSDGNEVRLVWGWKLNHGRNYFLPLESVAFLFNSERNDGVDDSDDLTRSKEGESIASEKKDEGIYVQGINEPEESKFEYANQPNDKEESLQNEHAFVETSNSFRRTNRYRSLFFWPVLLFLVITILTLVWWDVYDKREFSKEEIELIYNEVLPERPGYRKSPVQEVDFTEDDVSKTIIVGNIINVALKDKLVDFKKFVAEFSTVLKKENLVINYYDELTKRIQITIPNKNRDDIKRLIRNEMSEYSLLMWDESVFISERKTNDPIFKKEDLSWHMKAIGLNSAWEKTMGCEDVVIAIIDDGFDLKHLELRENIFKPFNVQGHHSNVVSFPEQIHGTHVASLAIGSANNGVGLCGVAPLCRFMPIQAGNAEGFFTTTDIIDGVLYAINQGADVVNLSLGRSFSSEVKEMSEKDQIKLAKQFGQDEEIFWDELFSMAESNNVFVVLAAGNEGVYAGLDPMRRSKRALKVGAIDQHLKVAAFSNYSSASHDSNDFIYAPGMMIYGAIPDNDFTVLDGTSMAAPLVAGSVALLKCLNPLATNEEILSKLKISNKFSLTQDGKSYLRIDSCM